MVVWHPRYLVTPKVGMTMYGIWFYLGIVSLLKELRKTYPFDLIDAHYVYPDGTAAVLAGKNLGVRWWYPHEVRTSISIPASPLSVIGCVTPSRKAAAVVAVSGDLKNKIVAMGIRGERCLSFRTGWTG